MTARLTALILLVATGLFLVACGSGSDDVPSLGATPTAVVEEKTLDDEAKVMAFTQCMRDQGIEYKDPMVDSDGNVQRPELAEGVALTREELAAPYQACAHHLEGLSLGREGKDMTELVDQMVELATCLRDKGYDVDDPTAETLAQWRIDFRVEFPWDDPEAKKAHEECNRGE
jgi:hypothetical protein